MDFYSWIIQTECESIRMEIIIICSIFLFALNFSKRRPKLKFYPTSYSLKNIRGLFNVSIWNFSYNCEFKLAILLRTSFVSFQFHVTLLEFTSTTTVTYHWRPIFLLVGFEVPGTMLTLHLQKSGKERQTKFVRQNLENKSKVTPISFKRMRIITLKPFQLQFTRRYYFNIYST